MQDELAKIALPTRASLHLPILVSLATDAAEYDRSDHDVSSLFVSSNRVFQVLWLGPPGL
jgi:hypothetical protein